METNQSYYQEKKTCIFIEIVLLLVILCIYSNTSYHHLSFHCFSQINGNGIIIKPKNKVSL